MLPHVKNICLQISGSCTLTKEVCENFVALNIMSQVYFIYLGEWSSNILYLGITSTNSWILHQGSLIVICCDSKSIFTNKGVGVWDRGEEHAKNETECQQQIWRQIWEVWPSVSSAPPPPPTRPHSPKHALKALVKYSHDPISSKGFSQGRKRA